MKTNILIKTFKPDFNRLDFIKFLFNNTDFSLIQSKNNLDKLIDGMNLEVMICEKNTENFINGLKDIGVFSELGNGTDGNGTD